MSATLQSINHNGAVIARQVGLNNEGVVWTVQPENFDSLIAHINKFGGPAFWSITPVA